MHITRDLLINAARDFVISSVKADRSIAAVYLTGSLLTDTPLLGGTTDIDLVFVHDRLPVVPREIHRFTDEITLDLYHHNQVIYEQPRLLRVDPTLGPPINSTRIILHDSQHWFEYTQAIITAQFDRADYHAERVRKLTADARVAWWRLEGKENATPKEMISFIESVEHATNAMASISGLPLTERRFMLGLAERCQAVESPKFALALASLMGFSTFDFSSLEEWINRWSAALSAPDNPSSVSPGVHPYRKLYYINAVKSHFENGQLESCLWIMLDTWTMLSSFLSIRASGGKVYPVFLSALGFEKSTFHGKVAAL
ncbi:MAG: hypothetical protein WBV22_12410, partial [Anaerolineaceae bacterium]